MKLIVGIFLLASLASNANAQCVTPTFSSMTPGSGPVAGGATFRIFGTNFCQGIVVVFGPALATLSSISSTQIVGTVPPLGAGTVPISITNPGIPSLIIANAFTYITVTGALVGSAGSPKFSGTGQQVIFFGYVAGGTPPYSFWWNFGDGTVGGGMNGTKTYATDGKYEVTFFVTDKLGAMSFSTTTAYITKPVTNFLTDDQGNRLVDDNGHPLDAK